MFSHTGAPGSKRPTIRGKKKTLGGGLTALGLGPLKEGSVNGVGEDFIRYTIPALELRMMLEEIRNRKEEFTLEYTRFVCSCLLVSSDILIYMSFQ